MHFKKLAIAAALAVSAFSFNMTVPAVSSAHAAACGASWAEHGTYKITGNFRGKVESAGAELTKDCRIKLKIPGVFTGGPVKRSGNCLRFTFKIEKEKGLFRGKWCNKTATVNWKGKNVSAKVKKVRFGAK